MPVGEGLLLLELGVEALEVEAEGGDLGGGHGELEEPRMDGAEGGLRHVGAVIDDPVDGGRLGEEAVERGPTDAGVLGEAVEGGRRLVKECQRQLLGRLGGFVFSDVPL